MVNAIAGNVRDVIDAEQIDDSDVNTYVSYNNADELEQVIGSLLIRLGLHRILGVPAVTWKCSSFHFIASWNEEALRTEGVIITSLQINIDEATSDLIAGDEDHGEYTY